MRWCVCLAGLVLVALAMTADSQVGFRANTVRAAADYGGGWWGGGGANFSSTPAEGYARGMSEVIRAQGDAYEAATRGAINYEEARASYQENKLRWHEISLQRQQMGEQQRAQHAAAERAARERRQASSTEKPPELLSDGQYDRATGAAHWPELLATEAFTDQRAKLDEALKVKAHTGENFQVNQQIINLTQDMQTRLKGRIRDVPPSTYLESRKFLDQLAREARMGLG